MGERKYIEDVPQDIQDLIFDGKSDQAFLRIKNEEHWSDTDAKEEIKRISQLLFASKPPRNKIQESLGERKDLEDIPREIQDLIFDGKTSEARKRLQAKYNLTTDQAYNQISAIASRHTPTDTESDSPAKDRSLIFFSMLSLFVGAVIVFGIFSFKGFGSKIQGVDGLDVETIERIAELQVSFEMIAIKFERRQGHLSSPKCLSVKIVSQTSEREYKALCNTSEGAVKANITVLNGDVSAYITQMGRSL